MRRKLPGLLAEAVLIIASILVAFALDDWAAQREISARTDTALSHLKQELVQNQALLTDDLLPRHQRILLNIETDLERINSTGETSQDWHTALGEPLFQTLLQDSAWTLLQESGLLVHMDYSVLANVARLYDLQETGALASQKNIITILGSRGTIQDKEGIETRMLLRNFLRELIAQEHYLASHYTATIQSLK